MAVKTPIYMDYHATTPVDPRVLEQMLPYFNERFGNAASRSHSFGWTAEKAVDIARERIATLLGAEKPEEIVFTSGATESNNLALKGVAEFYGEDRGKHIVTQITEHKAILDTCKRLTKEGFEITYLPVNNLGLVDPEAVKAAITDKTILVSIMLANNEVGAVQPVKDIGRICRDKGVLFHTDAVQGIGKTEFNVQDCCADLVSVTAHKMYGPKGVGALYVRRSKPRVRLTPQLDGGGHERGFRSGTLNVPGIVGFGAAADILTREWRDEATELRRKRDRLAKYMMDRLEDCFVNGPWPEPRLPGNLNLSFAYVEGEGLMMQIKDVAVSSGSACTSASLEPSYVLRAMGVEEELAHTSIRFGLGRFTTDEEVDFVGKLLVEKVEKLREMSPLYEMKKEGIDLKSIQWVAH